MRVWGVLAFAAGLGLSSGATAQNAPPPTYPPSLDPEPLLAWLQRETDIQPDKVLAVTPQALTSLMTTFPAAPSQGPRLVIRAEALSADAAARTGALSWHVSMSADCGRHRVRLGETTGYPERNLIGERKPLRPAETDWREPEAGTALDAAWRAACAPDFKGPFQQAETAAAPAARSDAPAKAAPVERQPVTEPKAAPRAPKPAPEPKSAPAAKTAPTAAPAAGGVAVQVGATPSEADAKNLLASLGVTAAGRRAWIETAEVGGKTWRRVLIGGFASTAEASGFCEQLKSAGKACFVRPSRRG